MIGAEFLRHFEPMRDRVEPDDKARAARLRHCAAIKPQKPKPLHHHGIAQRDVRGLRHAGHGGDTAIERRRLLVAQLVGQLEDPRARQDVAVFREPTQEMRVLLGEVMPVLAHAMALLRHVVHFAVIAVAVKEVFAPGDAVTNVQRVAPHVLFDPGADLLDHADDLVAENARTGIGTAALIRVDVGPADGGHRHPHQHLSGLAPDAADSS